MNAILLPSREPARKPACAEAEDHIDAIVETRLWIEEHSWLYALLKIESNVSPTFRLPDLISACVTQVFNTEEPSARIFSFLGTELVLRSPKTLRRREAMWRPQYDLLQSLQRSPANRHPNPKFQLDQITTACVALARRDDPFGAETLRCARLNMARRSTKAKPVTSA